METFYGLVSGLQADSLDIFGPTLTAVDPLDGEPGVALTKPITMLLEDESQINQASVKIYVNRGAGEELAYDGGVFQPGFDDIFSVATPTSTSVEITVDPTVSWPGTGGGFGSIVVRAEGIDSSGNPVQSPDSYTFSTEQVVKLDSATPVDYERIRVVYSADMQGGAGPASAADPDNYTITGGSFPLEIRTIVTVNTNVYDFVVGEMQDGAAYTVVGAGTITSLSGTIKLADSIIADPTADRADFMGVGDLPRLLEAEQVSAGVLNAEFSEPLNDNSVLRALETYQVTALGGASPLFITGVAFSEDLPTRVVLLYEGGSVGDVYRLTVKGLEDLVGNPIDQNNNSVLFKLAEGIVDELFTGEKYYFDTDLGAIALTFNTMTSRNIEDLAILRAKSIGHSAQFQLISESLKNSSVNRDDTKLNLFKG